MSRIHVHHAEQLLIPPAHKLALMAICDDAAEDTRLSFPGRHKLEKVVTTTKGRPASESTIKRYLSELIAAQLLARTSFARRGARTTYLVFPTPEEIEGLDTKDPDLNRVGQEAIDAAKAWFLDIDEVRAANLDRARKRAETIRRNTEIAADEPLDAPDEKGPTHGPLNPRKGPTEDLNGAQLVGPLPPEHLLEIPKSIDTLTRAAVENPGLDHEESTHPKPRPRSPQALDVDRVMTRCRRFFDDYPLTTAEAWILCEQIIRRSPAAVVDPTGYVIRTLQRSAAEWGPDAAAILAGRR
ncbi:MAG TPA: hypothetical protein VGC45_15635 [Gryllotalpicola sp.]